MNTDYMKNDLRTIDRTALKDINKVVIDSRLNKQQRIQSFINQIGNPYCYLDGDVVVGISYAATDISLEDRLRAYAQGLE